MTAPFYAHTRRNSDHSAEIEMLLLRYPRISTHELETLIDIFPWLPMVDMALMTADNRLAEPLAAFHRDHGDHFYAPVKALVILLAFPFAAIGALWWFVS